MMEYACPVWNPHTLKDKVLLEDVQKFACRMATKRWNLGYQELLDIMNAPLADRRLQLKLTLLYRIAHGLCYFPSDILCPRTNYYSHRTNHSLSIATFCPHKLMLITFVPHTTSAWNSLHQDHVIAPAVSAFKKYFAYYV